MAAAAPALEEAGAERRTVLGALLLAGVSGAFVALQQRLNGELSAALSDALVASVVSFGTGLVVVAAVVLSRPDARRRLGAVRGTPRRWRLAGVGGAVLVASGALAVPVVGVALFTVALVAGQTAGGLAVDRAGLGPGGRRPVTAPRVAGAVLGLVAVTVSGLGEGAREASPLLLLLVLVAGVGIAFQQAFNGQLRRVTGDAGVATLVNFLTGTAALLVALAVAGLLGGVEMRDWPGLDQWYLYLGGTIGAAFVATAAAVVRHLGVLRLGLAVVAGQLLGALLLDLLVPVHDAGVAVATVAGAALTLVAVTVSGRGAR